MISWSSNFYTSTEPKLIEYTTLQQQYRFVCTREFLRKSVSPEQNFVAATSRKKSNQSVVSVKLDPKRGQKAQNVIAPNSPFSAFRFE